MFCEKCGKMNDDGAIFCSNCSGVLRSRRQSTQPVDGGTKRFKIAEELTAEVNEKETSKPVVNDMPAVPVAVREKAAKTGYEPEYEEEPVRPSRRRKPVEEYIEDDYEDNYEKSSGNGSAWCGILSVVSWLSFICFTLVGILGGGYLMMLGINDSNLKILIYVGGACMILFLVTGFMILARNMVKIKILKTVNEIKNRK